MWIGRNAPLLETRIPTFRHVLVAGPPGACQVVAQALSLAPFRVGDGRPQNVCCSRLAKGTERDGRIRRWCRFVRAAMDYCAHAQSHGLCVCHDVSIIVCWECWCNGRFLVPFMHVQSIVESGCLLTSWREREGCMFCSLWRGDAMLYCAACCWRHLMVVDELFQLLDSLL